MNDVVKCIGLPEDAQTIVRAKYPIFDNVNCPRLRSLMAVAIGCDVNLESIVTPKQIHDFVSRCTLNFQNIENNSSDNENAYLSLKEFIVRQRNEKILKKLQSYKSKKKRDIVSDEPALYNKYKTMIDVFVDAFLYEPSTVAKTTNNLNKATSNDQNRNSTNNTYIHFPPSKRLHPYITAFDSECYNNDEVDCCCDVFLCQGTGNGKHYVMAAEGYCRCVTCKNIVCKECVCQKQNGEKKYCYDCFLPEISVLQHATNNHDHDYEPVSTIRERLKEIGITTNTTDNDGEILDIYEAINKESTSLLSARLLSTKITIPQQCATYLDELQRQYVSSFDMINGGRFVVDNRLHKEDVFGIIDIMAQLVNIRTNQEQNESKSKSNTYQVLPSILIKFAEGARVHSGYRLAKRCIRHAVDPQTYSVLTARGFIVRHDNQPAIIIHHRMKASMKNATYDVSVCFNSETIVSCTCTCKAGCHGVGRVICVHVLPVLYQITLLLFDGLAENLLVEISHHWRRMVNENEIVLTDTCKNKLKSNIMLLRSAACKLNSNDNEYDRKTIEELLVEYSVGTENAKQMILPPRDNKLLGPLRLQNLTSSTKIAKRKIQPSTKDVTEQQTAATPPTAEHISRNVESTTYRNIVKCIYVITKIYPSGDKSFLNDSLGYKVIENRAITFKYDNVPGNHSALIAAIRNLLEIANKDDRELIVSNVRPKQQQNTVTNLQQQNTVINLPISSPTPLSDITNKQQSSSPAASFNQNNETISPSKTTSRLVQKKKYHTCCACNATNTKQPDLIFTKVPYSKQRELKKTDNDNVRTTHAKRIFHRREFLRRLGISRNDTRTGLELCCEHKMEKTLIEFPWTDSNKKIQHAKAYLILPQDPSCIPLEKCMTREQKQIRQEAPPRRNYNRVCTKNVTSQSKLGRVCDYADCSNKAANGLCSSFICIPKRPMLLSDNDRLKYSNNFLMRHDMKSYFFIQNMLRIGSEPNDDRKDIRICNQHSIEKVQMECEWKDKQNRKRKTLTTMYLPQKHAKNCNNITGSTSSSTFSSPEQSRLNKGLGNDRFLQRQLLRLKENSINSQYETIESAMAMIQMWEENEGRTESINPTVANIAGIVGLEQTTSVYNRIKIDYPPPAEASNSVIVNNINQYEHLFNSGGKKTKVRLMHLNDKYIKTTTGFPSIVSMLSFVFVLCNGNPKEVGERVTKLTWLEEWVVYFEFIWGRSSVRWIDLEAKYDVNNKTLRKIFDRKLSKHLKTMRSWPAFVTFHEDTLLRKEKWSSVYGAESRIVMWDNTDVRMYKPSDSDAQRNTYSAYYAGNVAKGGVFIQPCGWMGTYELWVGAVSDSEYMERSGILPHQMNYIKEHDSVNGSVPWKIILDKGYRINSAAWRAGGQFVLQPSFAKSDRMFTSEETILSSTVAADRAANERAVRYAKLSGYIRKGLIENESTERLSDVWLAWGFQCNFIYKPVL